MSGDDELDAGWDEESESSAGGKTPASPPAAAGAGGARPTAAPETTRFNPDRATLPPPMPEQEYIEKILATDDGAESEGPKPKRGRLNTLIETDPLQYDSPDAHQRPTRPPASAAAAGSGDDGFLDLRLDEELARRSSAPGPEAVIPRPPPAPSKIELEAPQPVDPLDELPIDAVLDSLSPESLRPPPASSLPKAPGPAVSVVPQKPRKPYDSSPSIEVVELSTRPVAPQRSPSARAAPPLPPPRKTPLGTSAVPPPPSRRKTPVGGTSATPPPFPAVRAPEHALAPVGTPAARPLPPSSGAAKKPPQLSKTPLRVAAVKAAEAEKKARASARPPPAATPVAGTRLDTPASGTKAVGSSPKRASKPPTRPSDGQVERPTRAIRTPAQVVAVGQDSASGKALLKVAERFEAGDYGRALMLAEQVLELDPEAEELRHYAELCREKLRQTYLERIGTGRTILRVSVTDEKLRERSLDPRLAFLLSLLDGASSVDDVVDMSTMPPLEAVRALHELLVEGVIEVVERLRKAP